MFRLLFSMALLGGIGYGGWQAWNFWPPIKETVQEYIGMGQFHTLEAQYTPEQLMENARSSLIKTTEHSYLNPKLEFYPYLFMEVKFSENKRSTVEGIIMWNQIDGEMVLDTRN